MPLPPRYANSSLQRLDDGERVDPVGAATTATELASTLLVIAVAMVSIATVDAWLAKVDRAETSRHAANLYHDATVLLSHGSAAAAREKFAQAVAANRTRPEYQLGLADALLAEDRVEKAQKAVQAVLDQAETDGPANLLMARVLVRRNEVEAAKSYYHRAVFGRWAADAATKRMEARLELVDLLARHNAREELLAELLTIRATSSINPVVERKLGHLFILAGSPEQGAEIFRDLLRQNSQDADAYTGMGEAALARGNFQTARADLAIATRLAPGDTVAASLLRVADSVVSLDPLERSVANAEKLERSRRVLSLTLDATTRCGNAAQTHFADSARTVLTSRSPIPTDHAIESTASLAADLWRSIDPSCRPRRTIMDKALEFVQGKLAQ